MLGQEAMRNAFADEITALAEHDPRVVLLSGDIGNRVFDPFKATCPERFYNCGVAEANLIGMAAGLAMCGMRPVAYTIVPFITTRCLEQIRVDVCYHHQPVVIVGVGGGLSYAPLGATHHSCEDIAFLRMLPGMSVVCPGDAMEVRGALRAALAHDGPVYLRLGKKNEPVIHEQVPELRIGQSIRLQDGDDVALLSTGNLLPQALAAAELLGSQGLAVRVESFHSVKPLDEPCLRDAFARCRVVATIEEHSRLGGLGGAVAEWLADQWLADQTTARARLVRVGCDDVFLHEAGSQTYARQQLGLTPEGIARSVSGALSVS